MGPGFRAPAVGRFMEIVRAWALHPWPMTRAQGIATYKALGWVRADDDIESFTTDCTAGEAESFFYVEEGKVESVSIAVSPIVPPPHRSACSSAIGEFCGLYATALCEQWGEPLCESVSERGTRHYDWIVPGGALVSLTANKAIILLGVSSPESADELLAELRTGKSIFDDPEALP